MVGESFIVDDVNLSIEVLDAIYVKLVYILYVATVFPMSCVSIYTYLTLFNF